MTCIDCMRMRFTIAIAALLFALMQTVAHADIRDRFVFDIVQGDSDSLEPETFIPLEWNEHWFSGLGYSQTKVTDQDTIAGFPDSKVSESTATRRTRLNLINYRDKLSDKTSYSLGVDYDFSEIDKSEFGYFQLVSGSTDDYVAFDNNVTIDINGFDLRGDFTWGRKTDFALTRLSLLLSPANELEVSQTTDFKPIVPDRGTSSSSITQDMGYQLKLESRFRVLPAANIGFIAAYELLPLKYDVAILNPATLNSFSTVRVDAHQATTRIGVRIIFQHEVMDRLYPVIGYFNRRVETEDQGNGHTESTSDNFTSIGITGAF